MAEGSRLDNKSVKIDMMYPQDQDSDPYKQEYKRHMQEKPKIKI